MRRKLTSLSLLAFLGLGSIAFAQITGVVNDADNFPESDVEVTVKGTDKVTYTDIDGKFDIDAKIGDVIVINGKEFAVSKNDLGVLKYISQEEVQNLGEVVVLGYGKTQSKPKSNEAVVTVSAETLANRPNSSVLNSLQGTAPGLSINSASGSPGSGKINVKIRGINSINASSDPLYVIDGIATSATQFRSLNTEDIDNISVLKDAQATSIYGNRGANGVIVITTKGGKFNSGLQIDYSGLTSLSQFPADHYNVANTWQNLNIQKAVGLTSMSDAQIAAQTTNTNWKKQFFNSVGFSQQHTLGLRFGGENVNVYSSLGYMEQEGNIKTTNFKRLTFRNTINGKSKDGRFTYNAQVALSYSKRNQLDQETNDGVSNNVIQNPLFGYLLAMPNLQPYKWNNGREMYNEIGGNYKHTHVLQDLLNGGVVNQFAETTIFSTINARYKITDEVSVGNRLGVDYKESARNFARTPNGYLSVNVAANNGIEFGGFDRIENTKDVTINNVADITFDKKIDDHEFSVAGYIEYTKAHYIYDYQQQNGLNPLNWSLGSGTGWAQYSSNNPNQYVPNVSAQKINAGTLAFFATANYDYDSRFGFGATVRRDGSFRFSKENRWETFWSVSGRWNLDKEEFLQGTSVRMLKLRASHGITGNQNLVTSTNNANPLFTGVQLTRQLYRTDVAGYQGAQAFLLGNLSNENIKWETVTQSNVGVDFDLFNGFLSGSVDAYYKTTKNMFNQINVSATTGQWSVDGNNGKMENKGIEALLRFKLLKDKPFNLSAFVNGAYNRNKIVSMDVENLTDDNVNAVGGVMSQWNLYHYVGVNKETGEQQYIDKNGNITEEPTADDRRLTGKTPYAPFTGGFGFNADYKGFYLDVLFSFQAGGWSYDNIYSWLMDPTSANSYNVSANLLNAWTPENTNTDIASVNAYNLGTEGMSDRFLYKTDFIRLKNVTLGYGLSKKDLERLPIKSFRIFVSGENIATWTDWKGFDPEPVTTYSLGVYPNPQTFSLGVNIGL
ncbi:SusC/RagA family TonB-linked outer membrane protein [Faecalibacter rhinopitheci]|uniref:SusC/RagA family TonB-linked outer membrane protein n=1 Tax=Faecalibacter rhinopitheci TaxID=2779678 RepID=A0A8J7KA27_9FLAO|nr:SusC/RagA family TonB-linked outer membrane protein [Faecalibacter rhinopitheci]MBF0596980.1 SusC/RagA family TonB-linked outer membrane protein [Faecalibacter rhinopitheci]